MCNARILDACTYTSHQDVLRNIRIELEFDTTRLNIVMFFSIPATDSTDHKEELRKTPTFVFTHQRNMDVVSWDGCISGNAVTTCIHAYFEMNTASLTDKCIAHRDDVYSNPCQVVSSLSHGRTLSQRCLDYACMCPDGYFDNRLWRTHQPSRRGNSGSGANVSPVHPLINKGLRCNLQTVRNGANFP